MRLRCSSPVVRVAPIIRSCLRIVFSVTVRFGVSLVCVGLPVLTAGPLQAQTVTSLPLQRGFYVEAKTACGGASNATLVVVTKDGMNRAQVVDRFTKIDKIGPTTYRVAAVRTFTQSITVGDVAFLADAIESITSGGTFLKVQYGSRELVLVPGLNLENASQIEKQIRSICAKYRYKFTR